MKDTYTLIDLAKAQKSQRDGRLLGWIAVILGFAAIALFVMASRAQAKDIFVAETPNLSITLTDAFCTNLTVMQTLALNGFDMDKLAAWRGAQVLWQGQPLEACYLPLEGGVLLLDESGDAGMLPMELFRPADRPKNATDV